MNNQKVEGSFRDPNGFLFWDNNILYRQINSSYKKHYDFLKESGLYEQLVSDKLLIPQEEVGIPKDVDSSLYKIVKPDYINFISYPYEWCFSQLKDAALLTLRIQKESLKHGMFLKDASAYNVQFHNGQPIFIDLLSFEKYQPGDPWVAYAQFCQHFLAPLALMSHRDLRLTQLSKIYIDGIPLDLASKLLPFKTRFSPALFLHIHLHAKYQKKFSAKVTNQSSQKMTKEGLLALISNLEAGIKKLPRPNLKTEWRNYYNETNYSDHAFQNKLDLIKQFVNKINPTTVWDLGANTGVFSRVASKMNIPTVAFDIDPQAVEYNYQKVVKEQETTLLPLVLDLANPSPSLGWNNTERMSIKEREKPSAILMLALIHHLRISNHIPFEKIARFAKELSEFLIIEFVPPTDSHCQRILRGREHIFSDYNQTNFEKVFIKYFDILESIGLNNSKRVLYLMKRK